MRPDGCTEAVDAYLQNDRAHIDDRAHAGHRDALGSELRVERAVEAEVLLLRDRSGTRRNVSALRREERRYYGHEGLFWGQAV